MNGKSEFLRLNEQAISSFSIAYTRRTPTLLTKEQRFKELRVKTGVLIEKYFFDLCEILNSQLLLECGAHDAATSKKFVGLSENRKAIAFEANPFVFERFQSTIKNDSIRYVNIGLADTLGELTLNIPAHTPKSWSMQSSFDNNPKFSNFLQVKVNVDLLDNLVLNEISQNSTAMWIDVEGFGFSVLTGATKILSAKACKVIFIEVQDSAIWEQEQNAIEICSFLSGFGFVPLVRDYPLVDLYNIVFVKEDILPLAITLTNRFWFDFSRIRPRPFRFKSPIYLLSRIKGVLLKFGGGYFASAIHRVSRVAGSRSSRDHLQ